MLLWTIHLLVGDEGRLRVNHEISRFVRQDNHFPDQ